MDVRRTRWVATRAATIGGAALAASLAAPLAAQQLTVPEIDELVAAQTQRAFANYHELLSLANDAHVTEDMLRIVGWLEGAFDDRGFETERLPTPGSPLLLAERHFPGAERTVLVYLQSDGQPVDPAEWFQDSPYEPVLKERGPDGDWRMIPWERLHGDWDPDWRVFARSASDSKGPIVQFLTALDAMDAGGVVPDVNLKVIVDTEEEMGSPNLPDAVTRYRHRLAADMLIILDGPPHVSNRPTLKFGNRGISRFTLTTYGPRVPQHSGHYGNYAPNPAIRLAAILASMKDEDGRVTIPGFYDGVELDAETRQILDAVPDDEDEIHDRLGIARPDQVAGSLQEAVQYPSLNVRGLRSGWVGEEARTIVPATAVAEVDVRLVVESDPERLMGLIKGHIEELGYYVIDRVPTEDERRTHPRIATFTWGVSYLAYRTDFDAEPGRWLRASMRHLYGREPILIRTSGGSVPISPFVQTLGIPAVGVPTVNGDNNQHSPNENLRVGSFVEGVRVMLAFLAQELPGDVS
jgi:acetylornithine deacetylase/succinyl-diaminopimelate desuccinylase-like protein